jgi:aspartate-semialdehyde dehydrogenase
MADRNGPLRVALVGAAGTVGSQIAELIAQRDFSYAELQSFGSTLASDTEDRETDEHSASISELNAPSDLAAFDLTFLATPPHEAEAIVAATPGPILIDLSAANRLPSPLSPLVAPGLTSREQIGELKRAGVFGVPHPAAQVIASVLRAMEIRSGFVGAAIMMGASTRGREAIATLFSQSAEVLNARLSLDEEESQTAFNVFQSADADHLANVIAAQVGQLIEGAPPIVVQCTQMPAFHGSAVSLFLPRSSDSIELASRLRAAPGIILVENSDASTLIDAAGQEAVIVRVTLTPAGVALWCVFDAARLAALSAVWIAETLST